MENTDYMQPQEYNTTIAIKSNNSNSNSNIRVDYEIPKKEDYNFFYRKKYTIPYLKFICKEFKLKKTGNKLELIQRIYKYLRESCCVITIQKYARKYLVNKYIRILKLQIKYKTNCKNDTDFFTLEELSEIPNSHFFAFEENNNLWGFNIISIYNLFIKNTSKDILNPYTREKIKTSVFDSITLFIKLSNILGITINLKVNSNDEFNLSLKKQNENTSLELFQIINEFGHHSHYSWFLSLDKPSLVRFVRELIDIWEYRAELTLYTKCKICFPSGNPFHYNIRVLCNHNNFYEIQKNILLIISNLITKGITPEFCNIGASYVLCALTLVNPSAAEAMPWFYNSVM